MQTALLLHSHVARSCRFIAGCRYSAPCFLHSRHFHRTARWQSNAPRDPPGATDFTNDAIPIEARAEPGEGEGIPAAVATTTDPNLKQPTGRTGPYGSGVRRALRNRKPSPEYTPPVVSIPSWFREQNTIPYHDIDGTQLHQRPSLSLKECAASEEGLTQTQTDTVESGSGGSNNGPSEPAGSDTRYVLSSAVWEELHASAKAGLILPPVEFANEPAALKSHLVLHYHGNDGILFLDAVVQKLAQSLEAKLITLNAQDIAQLCGEHDRADSSMPSPIRSLGYEVYRPSSSTALQDSDEAENESDVDDSDMDGSVAPNHLNPRFIAIEATRDLSDIQLPNFLGLKSLVNSLNGPTDSTNGGATSRGHFDRVEPRWTRLINELISPSKEYQVNPKSDELQSEDASVIKEQDDSDPVVIVQVQDYRDIQRTREGARFISLLQQAIQTRRREGLRILLVGTVSKDSITFAGRDSARLIQNMFDDPFSRTMLITPAMDPATVESKFLEDRKTRVTDINIRHLQDMLRTRLTEKQTSADSNIFHSRSWSLDPVIVKESGVDQRYWTFGHVHSVASIALGCAEPAEQLTLDHIQRGLKLIETTDRIKSDWLQDRDPKSNSSTSETDRSRTLATLRKTCNAHEKKLLNGVVDASSIRTTFADVHVPSETVEALKTLTSLSLIRPEAFAYGVLATDKIPGLLLYGPPGTGKTLLAKAVARESGATVLEVSGSEVYDMYVGEGEKNVKAIFTLAKKLSPCVVFIDEADAIFCSRTGASSRTSHRELINQFLREWDGMNDLSAFIMVATNRPFDLDDAVLRRLPRRLLVDLPTEQDRRSILQIHLKDEQLEPSVDMEELAHRTPLYSGSDLKNLCVAAALACVREENDMAARHRGDESYKYPERRVLTKAHFERGMEEISASISEDMSSLTAIRKFDEKYGDRKGRRKKGPGWGFTPPNEAERAAETARVRT